MRARRVQHKQWVQGLSFGMSSEAALAMTRGRRSHPCWLESWRPPNRWAIATDLYQRILTLATLRPSWKAHCIDYSEIWSSWYVDGALSRFAALQRRANDLGTLASSRAP